jgi:endonuclease YncB( thermonuclease family)
MRLIAVPILLLVFAASIHGDEIRGKVVGIADGDTITVLDADKVQHKIRLEGIDSPEKGQAFGTKAREKLSEFVGEKEVVVRWDKKDRYGRILGDVHRGEHHINLEMVQDGMAWHYKQYSKSTELAEAEEKARKAKKGLWADKSPEPPWEFRKKGRKNAVFQLALPPSLVFAHASTKMRSNCHFPAWSEVWTMQFLGMAPSLANLQTRVGVQPRMLDTYSEPTVFLGICWNSWPENVRSINAQFETFGDAGLVGGGSPPAPGEVSLANHGVLFLDELPEFNRKTLEVMRQPLEDGVVTISRAMRSTTFPAQCMMVAALNPCPCGYRTDPRRTCNCTAPQIERYMGRISGPLLDRIDIHIEVPAVSFNELSAGPPGRSSAEMRAEVDVARAMQDQRFAKSTTRSNAKMSSREIREHCKLGSIQRERMRAAVTDMGLSARAHDKILRVARTIADLESSDSIEPHHIEEAINYRMLDRDIFH